MIGQRLFVAYLGLLIVAAALGAMLGAVDGRAERRSVERMP